MLPTPSVSRRRTCVPSFRYPSITTIAAVILLVACLYHARGFVPSHLQGPPVDRAAKEYELKAAVDTIVRENGAHGVAVDGTSEDEGKLLGDGIQSQVDTAIKEEEEEEDYEAEEEENDDDVLRQEDLVNGIVTVADEGENDENVIKESKVETGVREGEFESGVTATGVVDREESVGDDVRIEGDSLSEKEEDVLIEPDVEKVDISEKDVAADKSETIGIDISEKEESVSEVTSATEIDTAEKEKTQDMSAGEDADVVEEDGGVMRDTVGEDLSAAEKAEVEGVASSGTLDSTEGEQLIEEGSEAIISSGGLDVAEKTETEDSDETTVEREVEVGDDEAGDAALSLTSTEKLESEIAADEVVAELDSDTVVQRDEGPAAESVEGSEGLAGLEREGEAEDVNGESDENISSEKLLSLAETKEELAEVELTEAERKEAELSVDVGDKTQTEAERALDENTEDATGDYEVPH